jgi:hypothetical protein
MISQAKIETILREADIEGLIESGAPDDEYDSEAVEIAVALEKIAPGDLTEDNVLTIVCGIWNKSFGHDESETEKVKPYFRKIVRSILA